MAPNWRRSCIETSGSLGRSNGSAPWFRELLSEGAEAGDLRDDVGPDGPASYCLHALAGASSLPVQGGGPSPCYGQLDGLRPPR